MAKPRPKTARQIVGERVHRNGPELALARVGLYASARNFVEYSDTTDEPEMVEALERAAIVFTEAVAEHRRRSS